MIDNLYSNIVTSKDRILSIVSYIYLFPIFIIFWPHKSTMVKRHLIIGILLSLLTTAWLVWVILTIKGSYNLQKLNIINGIVLAIIIIFELVQIIVILKKKSY